MGTDQIVGEIRETNLSYMLLAQQMLRQDKATAMYRLGIGQDVAEIMEGLTSAQMLKMAGSNMLLCRFRFDDQILLEMLTNYNKDRVMSQSHAAILMAGQQPQTLC